MQRMSMIDPANATGKTKDFMDSLKKSMGKVPNIFKVIAHSPASIQMYVGIKQALDKGVLSAKIKEGIAILSAEINKCNYCLTAHTVIGKLSGLTGEEIERNKKADSSDAKTKAILQFAMSVINNRGTVSDEEYKRMRNAGVSEEETIEIIAEITLSIFTNYVNVVANTEIDF